MYTGYSVSLGCKKEFTPTSKKTLPNGAIMLQGKDNKGNTISTIVSKKVVGKGVSDAIDSTANAFSSTDDYLKAAQMGLDFTDKMLKDPTRIRRVEMRQDRRDDKAKKADQRKSNRQDAINKKKIAKQDKKTRKIERSEEIKEAKHQRKLKKFK